MTELILATGIPRDVALIECAGEDDPVHLFVTVPPQRARAHLVGKLTGKSAYFHKKSIDTVTETAAVGTPSLGT